MNTNSTEKSPFETVPAEQWQTPFGQDSFLGVIKKKEKKLLNAHILDDDLWEISIETGSESQVCVKLDEEMIHEMDLKQFSENDYLQTAKIQDTAKKGINEYYHRKTKEMFVHLNTKMGCHVPSSVDNDMNLGTNEKGYLCYYERNKEKDGKQKIANPANVYVEIDKITWTLHQNFDSYKEGVKDLCSIVFKIASGRLLASIIYKYNPGFYLNEKKDAKKDEKNDAETHKRKDENLAKYADHLQILVSFTILYRLCKHGRRVETSVVQICRIAVHDYSKRVEESSVQADKHGEVEIEFYAESIMSILDDPDIKELPVVIIAGYGYPRCGKSFFHNLMALWCKKKSFPKNKHPITGFKSGNNNDSSTKGLWMWREPLIISNGSHEQVAVLILDSEGIHKDHLLDQLITHICLELSTICIHHVYRTSFENDLKIYKGCQAFAEGHERFRKDIPYLFNHLIFLYRDTSSSVKQCQENMSSVLGEAEKAFSKSQEYNLPNPGQLRDDLTESDVPEKYLEHCNNFFLSLFDAGGIVFDKGNSRSIKEWKYVIKDFERNIESLKVLMEKDVQLERWIGDRFKAQVKRQHEQRLADFAILSHEYSRNQLEIKVKKHCSSIYDSLMKEVDEEWKLNQKRKNDDELINDELKYMNGYFDALKAHDEPKIQADARNK